MVLRVFYLICLALILAAFLASILTQNRELMKRSLTLVVLIHIVCLVIWAGSYAFAGFMLLVVIVGAVEVSICSGMGIAKAALTALVAAALFIILKVLDASPIALFVPSLILCALLLVPGIPRADAGIEGAAFVLGLVVPGAVALSDLFDLSSSHVIAIILLVQFNDAAGYLAGKRLGKTKLAFVSAISPNKTVEGYAAGAVAALVAAFALHTLIPAYPTHGMPLRVAALVASVFFLANAGDLAFSSMKRRMGVKDFSNVLSGHGGIMDRFDSLLCLAPLYFLLAGSII